MATATLERPATRRTLFELGKDVLAMDMLLDETGGEISTPEAVAAFDVLMSELTTDEAEKLDGWLAWRKQLKMEAAAAAAERDQWSMKVKSLEGRVAWIESVLKRHLEGTNRKKIETARGQTIAIQVNGVAPVVYAESIDLNALLDEFKKVRVEIDRSAVEAALKTGRKLDFAKIGEKGTHLRIR